MTNWRRIIATAVVSVVTLALTSQVQASQYGQYYVFGDSLSDNGRVLRETGYSPSGTVGPLVFGAPGIYQDGIWSNTPNFTELVPSLIGTPYVPSNDFAVGGAQSVHQAPNALLSPTFSWGLPDQIDTFQAQVGHFAPNDLINLWIGYNDLSTISLTATPAQQDAAVAAIVSNTTSAIARLASLGGQDFVVFDQETYRPDGRAALAQELNSDLGTALQTLSASGLNIVYFDVNSILTQLRANPTAYGFAADAGTVACSQDPVCAQNGATTGLENQYISPEGIHLTGRVNTIVANDLAAQLVPEPGAFALLASALGGLVGAIGISRRKIYS